MTTEQDSQDPTPASSQATPALQEPQDKAGTVTDVSDVNVSDAGLPEDQGAPDATFSQVDPQTLPPELKSKYDSMLSDYKKKTADLAQQRREAQASLDKAKLYDQIASDEAFVTYWNNLSQKEHQKEQQRQPDGQPRELAGFQLSEQDYQKAFESPQGLADVLQRAIVSVNENLKNEIKTVQQENLVRKAGEFINEFSTRPEYSEFKKLNKHGFITYQLRANPAKTEKEWEPRLKWAYDNAKKVYSDIYQEGYQAGLGRMTEKTKGSTMVPSAGADKFYAGGDPKKLTVREALELATKGIRVQQQ